MNNAYGILAFIVEILLTLDIVIFQSNDWDTPGP
jgi:hypothetical protein